MGIAFSTLSAQVLFIFDNHFIDALQQARLTSIVEEGNTLETWLQRNDGYRGTIEGLYHEYKERYRKHNYVTKSYQPVTNSIFSHIDSTKESYSFRSLSLSM